ncbi:MAG TPA: MBL fold metallo-hydrolase [Myxococcales bacterium]|jgi:glyoxylase-like metal-dependent hydrolase (beta-lactamase superfamily II)
MAPFERLERLRISNVWLFDGGADGRWLIDCGHVLERRLVLSALKRRGIAPRSLAGILLTHRHSDHAGNAAFFQNRFGLAVWAHRADAEILDGGVARPEMPFGRGDLLASLLTVFENRLPARAPTVRRLEEGQVIAGLEVFFVPGHTEGSVFFRHPASGALVSGDTILNAIPPMAQREGLALPHPTFSTDWSRACASLAAFQRRGIPYRHVLSGHGPALLENARERVDELLRRSGLA